MDYKSDRIEDFLEKLSSNASMPGGGVASALVAANGISLVLMVCNLTIGKEKYKEYESHIEKVKRELEEIKNNLLILMNKDAETFSIIEQVFKMPNETEEQKKSRKKAMQEACKICCTVPKEIINVTKRGIILAKSIEGKSNISASSDLVVGITFLKAAIDGAWENVKINLKYIEDKDFIKENEEYINKVKGEI